MVISSKWSSRKFWTVNFWQAISTICLFYDKIDGSVYAMLTAGLIGIYAAGNFADKRIGEKDVPTV